MSLISAVVFGECQSGRASDPWPNDWSPYSGFWYRNFRDAGRAMVAESQIEDYLSDPRWLMLSTRKKEIGQNRLAAMIEYENNDKKDDEAAQAAARKMGITAGQFYALRRKWHAKRSIHALIPRAGGAAKRSLNPEVSEVLFDRLKELTPFGDHCSIKSIADDLLKGWPPDLDVPSESTLRRYIGKALDDQRDLTGRVAAINNDAMPRELANAAERYGEVLEIDHIALDIFVVETGAEGSPGEVHDPPKRVPLATWVIDGFTRTITGYALSFEEPSPDAVLTALEDAEHRSRASSTIADTIRPRIGIAMARSRAWRELLAIFNQADIEGVVRRTDRLHYGGPTLRLIGRSLGDIKFARNKGHRLHVAARSFDPEKDVLVSLEELRLLLDRQIKELAERRIPKDTAMPAFDIGLYKASGHSPSPTSPQ